MMNRSTPLSTLNLKSTKSGKSALLEGAGYLHGKSGGGKGKFDLEFIMERDDEFTGSTINPPAVLKSINASGSFSKSHSSGAGNTITVQNHG